MCRRPTGLVGDRASKQVLGDLQVAAKPLDVSQVGQIDRVGWVRLNGAAKTVRRQIHFFRSSRLYPLAMPILRRDAMFSARGHGCPGKTWQCYRSRGDAVAEMC